MTTDLRPAAVALALEAEQLVRLLNRAGRDEHELTALADTISERAAAISEELHASTAVGNDRP